MIKKWFKSGDPWIWLNAAAVSASLIIVLGLLALIAVKGLSHFWPKSVMQANYVSVQATTDSNSASIRIIGELHEDEEVTPAKRRRRPEHHLDDGHDDHHSGLPAEELLG